MAECKKCVHEAACAAWIRHGKTLYEDFEYSVEDCPNYAPKCPYCIHCERCTNWRGKEYWGCSWHPYEVHEVDEDHFCSHAERKAEWQKN